jgi:hypothetical protein
VRRAPPEQLRVLRWIRDFIAERGPSPTLDEVAEGVVRGVFRPVG